MLICCTFCNAAFPWRVVWNYRGLSLSPRTWLNTECWFSILTSSLLRSSTNVVNSDRRKLASFAGACLWSALFCVLLDFWKRNAVNVKITLSACERVHIIPISCTYRGCQEKTNIFNCDVMRFCFKLKKYKCIYWRLI